MRRPYERRHKGALKGWYILWEGKQTWLGRFKGEALANWRRLQDGKPVVRPVHEHQGDELTVQSVVDIFLDHLLANRSDRTYRWYKNFLKSFVEFQGVGRLPVSKLKRSHVQRWLDVGRLRWNENSAHGAARAVVAAFNYAVKMDELRVSPLRGFEKPPASPREECELSPAEWRRLLAAVSGELRDAVVFMRLSGARPMECRHAEKRHFNAKIPALIFPKQEAKGKRRERVIHLSGEALTIVQKLALRYPTGPLFRNGHGEPWTKDGMVQRFKRLATRLKIPHLIAYSMRHTFATDAVVNEVDAIVLSKLMGHANTKMLEHVYARHARRTDFMNRQVAKAIKGI